MLFNKIKGFKQIFRKGNENWRMRKLFDQERPVITVAQDGSGDFQKIEDALRIATELSGATILIKKGDYYPEATSTTIGLSLCSNLAIEGAGLDTTINIAADQSDGGKTLNLEGFQNIKIKKLWIKQNDITDITSGRYFFYLSGAINILMDEIKCTHETGGSAADFQGFGFFMNGTTEEIRLNKSNLEEIRQTEELITGTGTIIKGIFSENKLLNFWTDQSAITMSDWKIDENWINGSVINGKMTSCVISGNTGIDEINLVSGSTLNIVKGNKLGSTIYLSAGADYNNIVGNIVNSAVSDLGTGNTVANNTVY